MYSKVRSSASRGGARGGGREGDGGERSGSGRGGSSGGGGGGAENVAGSADGDSEYVQGGDLTTGSAHVYVTMLRHPVERMLSWHAWCHAVSADHCNSGEHSKYLHEARKRNVSPATAFYNSRARRMRTVSLPTTAAGGGVHTPMRLEARLDDNYQTRAICGYDASFGLPGNDAYGLDAPVSEPHLRCAMSHLYYDYSMIGVTHRYEEFVCVLCAQFGWELVNISKRGTYYKDTPTGQHGAAVPPDFVKAHGSKWALDAVLFRFALVLFEEMVDAHPACRRSSSPAPSAVISHHQSSGVIGSHRESSAAVRSHRQTSVAITAAISSHQQWFER